MGRNNKHMVSTDANECVNVRYSELGNMEDTDKRVWTETLKVTYAVRTSACCGDR